MRPALAPCLSSLAFLLVPDTGLSAQAPPVDKAEQELLEFLNTPIQGASKREQRLLDSPQAVEVLTAEDIRQMGLHRLQDALRIMTSIDLLESDLGYTVIGMRGVMQEGQPRTVQVLIDGVPMYQPMGGTYDLNNLPLPLDLVERVEVIRGPSSTLYGANAVVGVVAITTRKPAKGLGGHLRASGADKSTARGAAHLAWSDGAFGLVAGVSGASYGNSGYRAHKLGATTPDNVWIIFDGAENGPGHQSDKGHQSAAHARLEYRRQDTSLWLSAGKSHKKISPVGQAPISYINYRIYDMDTLLAGWNQSWGSTFSTELRLHRMRAQVGAGPAPILSVVMSDPAWNVEHNWGDTTSDQFDLQANWNPSATLHFVFGADTRRMTFGVDPTHGITQEARESASGAFASVDWNPAPGHAVSAGFRVENESLGGSRVSPRAIYVWNPGPSSALRFAFLTSTRSPQYFEQRINFKAKAPLPPPYTPAQYPIFSTIQPNPDLKPEKTTNLEVGYRHTIGAVTLDATVYRMTFSDLINQVTLAVTPISPTLQRVDSQFQNTGDATNTGAELAATFLLRKGWQAGLNVGYVDFKKDRPAASDPLGEKFAYTSGTKANAWTRFTQGRLTGYLALQYFSATDVEALQVYGAPLYDKRDALFQVQASVAWELVAGLSLGAYVRNGAKEFTEQGATGPDRPIYYLPMRREAGLTASWRF